MCSGQNSLGKGGLNAKAQMPTEVLHGKISQRSIRFCFNCGVKINGVLWTLIEEGIIKEK